MMFRTLLSLALLQAAADPTTPAPGLPAPKASTVTLQGPVKLSQAIAKLSQTGNTVIDLRAARGQESPDVPLNLDLVRVPFWQAVDAVAAAAGLRPQLYRDRGTGEARVGLLGPNLPGTSAPQPVVAYSGPFRLAIKRVVAVRNFEDESLSQLQVVAELAWEARPQPWLFRLEEISASDGVRGRTPASTAAVKLLGEFPVELLFRLPLPARGAARLTDLRVTGRVIVPPELATVTFERLVPGAAGRRAGVEARIIQVSPDPLTKTTAVTVGTTYPPGSWDFESHQTWLAEQHGAWLREGATGQERRPVGYEAAVDEGKGLRITYRFTDPPGGTRGWLLVYRAPAAPAAAPATFHFREVPLP
jgi:hypothetical protein